MPRRIRPIHRIPHAIHIRIQPTPSKRTPTVRAMKPHQSRVVGAVAVAQLIPTDIRFAQLTVEAQSCRDVLLRGLLAVGGVGDGIGFTIDYFANNRAAAVGRQQHYALAVRSVLIDCVVLSHYDELRRSDVEVNAGSSVRKHHRDPII